MEKKSQNRAQYLRIVGVGSIFIFFFFVMLLRSYQLQILGNAKLNNLVESQYKTNLIIQPKRGAIYDRNGEVLAMDAMVASIGIHPQLIKDKAKAFALLKNHTSLNAQSLNEKLSSPRRFLWVERRIPLEHGNAIAEAKIQGIQVEHEFRRYYPNKSLAGHLLGAVGYDAKALGGLESAYDHYLKSESQLTQAERDARGKLFTLHDDPDLNHDLYLTIDKNIQYFTEQALKEQAVKHNVKNGFAIVMSVKTGEILAMANYPEFNPNSYWSYPQATWKNHAIIDTFEPGSTFKSVLMGSALNSGKVRYTDRFNCEGGQMRIGKNVIRDSHQHGVLSAQEILQVSSNIGVTKIAYKIGKETFYNFIMNLGFSKRTDLGLSGEASGFLRNYKTWKDIEFSNIAFGQGVSVTGLQMVSAYSAFANGGTLMKPLLVKSIVNSKGELVIEQKPTEKARIMAESAAKDLQKMLFTVTQPGGTATTADVEGYLAGGKTGTAQKVDEKTHRYAQHEYVSSFIGFTPLDNPELVVYVVYDTPRQNGYYGGVVAAPAFKKIAQNSLAYLGVAPTSEEKFKIVRNIINPSAKSKKDDEEKDLVVKNIQDFKTIESALEEKRMPDLKGLSLRALLKLSQKHNVKLNIDGDGFVVKQAPAPDTKLSQEWKLILAGSS